MKPRERLSAQGAALLSNAELLAILLGTGSAKQSVNALATTILDRFEDLHRIAQLSIHELAQIHGVGIGKASRIQAAFELAKRLQVPHPTSSTAFKDSRDVYRAFAPRFLHESVEKFFAVALDVKNKPLAEFEIARGGVAECPVQIADAFRPLVRQGAFGALFIHNHPSGDPTPSPADIELTERLQESSHLLGIRLADHVIIGAGAHFSFCDAGKLRGRLTR